MQNFFTVGLLRIRVYFSSATASFSLQGRTSLFTIVPSITAGSQLKFTYIHIYTSPILPTPQFHAFSSRSGNLNFGPKSGYKINVEFGPGWGLTIGPVSNSDTDSIHF